MNVKVPIAVVGSVSLNEAGGIYLSDWKFAPAELSGIDLEMPVEVTHEGLAGWTHFELHAIAHGVPCACPLGQIPPP